VKQLVRHLPRAALWIVVLLLLAGTLATVANVQAGSTPNYTLTGYVHQPGALGGVPAGVQVDLTSRATGAQFTTTTNGQSGKFTFTTASTGGALVPGYWGLSVPPQGNLSVGYPQNVGVLPYEQNSVFSYWNATALTTNRYDPTLPNVVVLAYNGTLTGIVRSGGTPVPAGVQVQLLAPQFAGFVLANNTTTSSGSYSMKVPYGTWVLKTTLAGPTTTYSFLNVTIPSRTPVSQNVTVGNYLLSGFVYQAGTNPPVPVPNGGNVTLWDGYGHYIYSTATPGGGFYSAGTYPGNFSAGDQTFSVILSTVGYATTSYQHTVSNGNAFSHNVFVSPMTSAERGNYTTTLNFTKINVGTGSGNLTVTTVATLGNDTVFANLPNSSIGQMWGQLGLDFHSGVPQTSFSAAQLSAFYAWENQSGPFFPAVQAGVAINSTTFLNAAGPGTLSSYSSTCATTCGLTGPGSASTINLGWAQTYALNGTVTKNSGQYTLSFGFQHPTSSDTMNYTVVLPAGYVLAAGTAAPRNTQLLPAGPDKTWTKFNLVSQPSTTTAGTASFTIVKYANMTANVNISVNNFAFSSANILNSTHNYYTAVVGVGQNVTFSALNSTYPAGTNGTKFVWNFGDGGHATTYTATTNHTYTAASTNVPDNGTLTVTSSGGLVNSTTFSVWVGEGPVTAVISSNATASQNRSANGVPYVFINWGTVLYFNASASTAAISPTATVPGVLSVASFAFTAKGYKATQNFSVGQGANFSSPYTYQFLGAGVYYSHNVTINNVLVPFRGWWYNLSLNVWDGMGQTAATTLIVLVNDTQSPVSSFQILNSAGKAVSGSGVVTASNLTAKVQFNGANASDPGNGSISKYYWLITNSGNSSVHLGANQSGVKPYPTYWLMPQQQPYTVNLTVWDLNGNKGWTTQSLAVSVNSTTSPIMAANNLTAPSSYNSGSSYTIWVNVTAGGGTKAVALNVQVSFYLTSPSGTSRSYIAGSPGTVKFYNYTSGVVNSVPFATGSIASMSYNTTYRAVISWTPPTTGNFVLYANATASNEYSGNYINGPQVTSQTITVNPNPTTQLLEYVAIAVAVIVVIVAIIFLYRRRTTRTTTTKTTTSRSGMERSRSKTTTEDDEDDDS
jgi:hypothetical protein